MNCPPGARKRTEASTWLADRQRDMDTRARAASIPFPSQLGLGRFQSHKSPVEAPARAPKNAKSAHKHTHSLVEPDTRRLERLVTIWRPRASVQARSVGLDVVVRVPGRDLPGWQLRR